MRIRPRLGRLTRAQLLGICAAADAYGSGLIDVTNRANLQIRGVAAAQWRALTDQLVALELADADPAREAKTNILVPPDWQAGDDTHRIGTALLSQVDRLPALPSKVGFVIDAGVAPMLLEDPGDFRVERAEGGGLLLRADGHETGVLLEPGCEVEALVALARWFESSGGAAAGRVARHQAALPAWAASNARPAQAAAKITPGHSDSGLALAAPFGRIDARAMARLVDDHGGEAVRVTPWRIVILEGASAGDPLALRDDAAASAIWADACVGAPACPQATVETRDLARQLAPHVDGALHVSGCAKGCARARPADIVLTGRDGRFDLVVQGRAGDLPIRTGLDAAQILAHFGVS